MPFERDRALPAARRLRDLETKRLARRQRLLDQLHALDLLELAHGLRSFGRDGAKAIGEFLQRLDFLLLIFVGGQLLLVAFLALRAGNRCSCRCKR